MSFFGPGGMLGSLTTSYKPKEEDTMIYPELSTTTTITRTSMESIEDDKAIDLMTNFNLECLDSTESSQSNYHLQILGPASNGARTRTETQIKLVLRISFKNTMEPCYGWKWLQLPQHLFRPSSALKGKTFEDLKARADPIKTLHMKVRILKSDNHHDQIYSCLSCILREKKKKSSKKRPQSIPSPISSSSCSDNFASSSPFPLYSPSPSSSSTNPDWIFLNEPPLSNSNSNSNSASIPHYQEEEEREGIIIFAGSSHLLQILDGDVMVPCRLTCYCRHHNEPIGFRIAIDLYDYKNHFICSAISPSIMVTDDHKKNGSSLSPFPILSNSNHNSSIHGNGAIINGSGNHYGNNSIISNNPISLASPINNSLNPMIIPSPPSSISSRTAMIERKGIEGVGQIGGMGMGMMRLGLDMPMIVKVVPSEGPMYGGVEITALGHNLTNDSILYFGNAAASMVMLISSNTMIVRLPPSLLPGMVPVSISNGPDNPPMLISSAHHSIMESSSFDGTGGSIQSSISILPVDAQNSTSVLFNYKNDLDRAMMELALQLIGVKLTGRVDDARDVALKIIQDNTMSLANFSFSPSSFDSGMMNSNNNNSSSTMEGTESPHSSSSITSPIERALITGLTATEMHAGVDFSAKNFLQFRTAGGHTLLHLAAFGKYTKLFEYLVSFDGVIISAVDRNGFTASNFAYLQGMDSLLESLGLEEDDDENDYSLAGSKRLTHLLASIKERQRNQNIKIKVVNWFGNLLKRPQKLKGQFHRLRTGLWRKYFPSTMVKPFYYKKLERRASQLSVMSNQTTVSSIMSLNLRRDQLHQIFQNWKRIIFVYFWIPLIMAVFVAWFWKFLMMPAMMNSNSIQKMINIF